jgi:hypothetical protein
MLNQAPLNDQLVRQRIAELHAAASRERLARRTARVPRTRVYVGRMLIALGSRLAPTETRASNRVTKLAGR